MSASGLSRTQIADHIASKLAAEREALARQYRESAVRYFAIDNLLPTDLAEEISRACPRPEQMEIRSSIRERKYVTAQMNECNPLVEEALFAFHDPRVVKLAEEITGLREVEADHHLYAGGVSLMARGHYLHPHIDNSHDKFRRRYRVLNLLYYTSRDWKAEYGGSLELWPDGPTGKPLVLPALFNRLVVMATGRRSWHSVNEIRSDQSRVCVSNYYFSERSPEEEDYFHPTSFRGRPEQPLRDLMLRFDAALRTAIRRLKPGGLVESKHYYHRKT